MACFFGPHCGGGRHNCCKKIGEEKRKRLGQASVHEKIELAQQYALGRKRVIGIRTVMAW